jgi:hypothetical protein
MMVSDAAGFARPLKALLLIGTPVFFPQDAYGDAETVLKKKRTQRTQNDGK